jgi:hypothetical protein
MYRTIIAGCNGRERGRGAASLAHAISLALGARLCWSACTIILRSRFPAATPTSARRSSTSCEPSVTSSPPTRSSASRQISRPPTRFAASRTRSTPIGSRRWGPVHRLALGSTSERVIRHAACPVLVPPRRADTEHVDLLLGALMVAAP